MSMASATRRSGLTLALLGLLGIAFFWLTDPHFGPNGHAVLDSHRHVDWRHWIFVLRGSPDNAVDAANQALTGTLVGIAGSIAILVVGLWLVTRRRA
ncbi:MAG TPA: hypothetical protein VFC46_00940 [Humisphaera sp.]|nr:hypothetical protein [Humisphaera sp.]